MNFLVYVENTKSFHDIEAVVPKLWCLTPDDLRWSWCNNTRDKVQNKCNALESSLNRFTTPSGLWKSCLPWNWSLASKRLGAVIESTDILWLFRIYSSSFTIYKSGGGKFRKSGNRAGSDVRSSTPIAELCPATLSQPHVYSEAAHQIYSTGLGPGFAPWMEAADWKQRIW